jgi:hypothetical protein
MFDEANRQFRMNRHEEDKDNELDRLTDHLGEMRQTIVTLINYMGDLDVEVGTLVEEHLETLGKHMD